MFLGTCPFLLLEEYICRENFLMLVRVVIFLDMSPEAKAAKVKIEK